MINKQKHDIWNRYKRHVPCNKQISNSRQTSARRQTISEQLENKKDSKEKETLSINHCMFSVSIDRAV